MKEPTLFKVELLESTFGNDVGDKLNIKEVDKDGNIYYYDSFRRWCYLTKFEQNKTWQRIYNKKDLQ